MISLEPPPLTWKTGSYLNTEQLVGFLGPTLSMHTSYLTSLDITPTPPHHTHTSHWSHTYTSLTTPPHRLDHTHTAHTSHSSLRLSLPLPSSLLPSPHPTLTPPLSIIFSLHPFTLHLLLNSPPSSPRPISPLLHSLYTLYITSNPFPSPYIPPPSSHTSSLLPILLPPLTHLLPPPTLLLPPPYTPPPSSLHSSSLLPTLLPFPTLLLPPPTLLLLPPTLLPPPSSLHSPSLLLPPYTPPPSSLHSSSLLPTLLPFPTLLLPPPTLLLLPPYTPPPSSLLPTLLPPPYTPPPSSLHSSSLLPTLLLLPPYTHPPSSLHSSLFPTLLLPPPTLTCSGFLQGVGCVPGGTASSHQRSSRISADCTTSQSLNGGGTGWW